MNHCFKNHVCINCEKNSEDIFYELLEIEDVDILKFNFKLQSLTYNDFLSSLERILINKNCLNDTEFAIFSII